MNIEQVSDLFREAVGVALLVSAPMLLVAMAIGLVISVFQAATQVNEQTLTFVPKIVAVLGVFALLFPWIMGKITEFGVSLLELVALGGSQ